MRMSLQIIIFFGLLGEVALGQVPSPPPVAPAINQKADHKKAYNAHPERGEHIDIKITPPEKRGKDTMMLVEVYNRSKTRISVMSFDIAFKNHGARDISSRIELDDLGPGWSVPRWVKIPGSGKIPVIDSVVISAVRMVDDKAKEVSLKVYSDLIKE